MIIPIYFANPACSGYIAGTGSGIVTAPDDSGTPKPAQRAIILYEVKGGINVPTPIARQVSLPNGHYMFKGLDPNKQYLIMCRDLKPQNGEQALPPAAWDYVTPATDLTLAEQYELWQSWQ